MKTLLAFLKLIRWQNLIIVAATQYAIRHLIFKPLLKARELEMMIDTNSGSILFAKVRNIGLQMGEKWFFLLVLATVLVTAAGYIINDINDATGADEINSPDRVLVKGDLSLVTANTLYWVFNLAGIGLAFLLGYLGGFWKLGVLFMLISGALWYYSHSFKHIPLVGNLVVAALSAIVPFVVALVEIPLLNFSYQRYMDEVGDNFSYELNVVSYVAVAIFLVTLLRELIKDAEDFEGDSMVHSETFPIKYGIRPTKLLITVLILATIAFLIHLQAEYFWQNLYLPIHFVEGYVNLPINKSLLLYSIGALQIPLLSLLIYVWIAKTKKQFHYASLMSKFIMVLGLGLLFVFSYQVNSIIHEALSKS